MPIPPKYCETPGFILCLGVNLSMIKLLTIAVLGVVLYRLLFPSPRISRGQDDDRYNDDDFIDYEEID